MKKGLPALFTLFLASVCHSGFSQIIYPEAKGKWAKNDYQFSGYFNAHSSYLTDYASAIKNASDEKSFVVPDSISQYIQRTDRQQGSEGGYSLYLSAGFNPVSKKTGEVNKRRIARIGLGFQDIVTIETAYTRTEVLNADTSVSRDYFINGKQQVISIDGMYTFSTDVDKAVNVFAGFGAGVGFSVSHLLEENFNRNLIVRVDNGGTVNDFTRNFVEHNGKVTINLGLFLPVGLNARIYKNVSAMIEARGALNYVQTLGGTSFIRPHILAGFGLRYTFGEFPDREDTDDSGY